MKSGSSLEKYSSPAIDMYTTIYKENSYHYVWNHDDRISAPLEIVKNGAVSYRLKISKDGAFESWRTIDSQTVVLKGTWNFISAMGKYKNKEQIIINITSANRSPLLSSTYTGNKTFYTYRIKELRNKKLVLESEDERIDQYYNFDYYFQEIYTFEQ